MQKVRGLGFVLVAMLMGTGTAKGLFITEIKIAQAIPVTLSYASGSGVLTYDEKPGAQALVTFDDSSIEIFTTVNVSSVHNLTTDTSSGGEASGVFDTGINAGLGTISVLISNPLPINPGSDVTSITLIGTMDFFNIQANNGLPNPTMNGVGVFTLTTNTVASVMGIIWADQAGQSAVRTTNQSLTPSSHPADLSGDISSISGSMALFASDPIIPEPMSLALLGLGGMTVLTRRRSRSRS